MKITKEQLKKMISEEVVRALPSKKKRLAEGRYSVSSEFYEADPYDALQFAEACMSMGQAVFEQLQSLVDDVDSGINPNAVDVMDDHIGGMNQEIDTAIEEYRRMMSDDESEDDDGTWAAAWKANK